MHSSHTGVPGSDPGSASETSILVMCTIADGSSPLIPATSVDDLNRVLGS